MAGGAHRQYKTAGVFDLSKWIARMSDYNTTQIRERNCQGGGRRHRGGGQHRDGRAAHTSWPRTAGGPRARSPRPSWTRCAGYEKGMFPSLPVVGHDHEVFNAGAESRLRLPAGPVRRPQGPGRRVPGRRPRYGPTGSTSTIFSLNVIDGGTQASRNDSWDFRATGGRGTFEPNCRMTAQQILDFGSVLGRSRPHDVAIRQEFHERRGQPAGVHGAGRREGPGKIVLPP